MSTEEPKVAPETVAATATNETTPSDPAPAKAARAADDVAVRFGDVVKLFARSAFVESKETEEKESEDDSNKKHHEVDGKSLMFQLHGVDKNQQQILVLQPVTGEKKSVEAEFIIGSTKDEKAGEHGTVLHYKQPFVLKTSDNFSLNNKVPKFDDMVSLMKVNVKGEMFLTIEKDDYTAETPVQDGDNGFVLNVVDSNRIRKKYNKKLTHFATKNDSRNGGYVCCGTKGTQLQFGIVRDPDPEKKATANFIAPGQRGSIRRSLKGDESIAASIAEEQAAAKSVTTTPAPATTAPAPAPATTAPATAAPAPAAEQEEKKEVGEQKEKPDDAPTPEQQDAKGEANKPKAADAKDNNKDKAAAPSPKPKDEKKENKDKAAAPSPKPKDEKKENKDKAAAPSPKPEEAKKEDKDKAASTGAASPPPAPAPAPVSVKTDEKSEDKDKAGASGAKGESEVPSKDDPKPSSTQAGASEVELQDEHAANSCVGSWNCVVL